MSTPAVIAIVAHPDDIEFQMAGTLLLLGQAGFELHYLTVANGCCGSTKHQAAAIARIRRAEAKRAAAILGARLHPSLCNDLEVLYDLTLLRRLTAIIREVKPRIILTHPPFDYMEDHTSTCRLVVTAAFAREMPNFASTPMEQPFWGEVTIYHSTPHGLVDALGRQMIPDLFVNTEGVHNRKRDALAAHESQAAWLETSQGATSPLTMLDHFSSKIGEMSGNFGHAEGFWRHSHLGFCHENADPLRQALGPLATSLNGDVAARPATDPSVPTKTSKKKKNP
jgi:N-acetylglucosamine malate deacetylase 1